MQQFTYVSTQTSITLYLEGNSYSANSDHPNFNKILKKIKKGQINQTKTEKLILLFDLKESVRQYLNGSIEVSDAGTLTYNGEVIDNVLTHKILDMQAQDFDIEPMLNFLVNLRENPSFRAQNELMKFLEKANLPITPDGMFIGYRSVKADYMDYYSGTFDNSIGQVCKMERRDVNEDPKQSCQRGLHIGSKDYSWNFVNNGRLMVCAINPRDVVAVPESYMADKMRVCEFKVIAEVERTKERNEWDDKAISDYQETDEDLAEYFTDCEHCGEEMEEGEYVCSVCGYEH